MALEMITEWSNGTTRPELEAVNCERVTNGCGQDCVRFTLNIDGQTFYTEETVDGLVNYEDDSLGLFEFESGLVRKSDGVSFHPHGCETLQEFQDTHVLHYVFSFKNVIYDEEDRIMNFVRKHAEAYARTLVAETA